MAIDKIPISKFSLMTRLTQKALRLYDKKGILVPQEKNGLTGYRYYTISQIDIGLKIKSLSMLGFGLDQIADFLDALQQGDEEKIKQLIQKKIKQIRKEQRKLANYESLLLRKNKGVFEMTIGDPIVKDIPEMRVLSIRKIGTFDPTIGELIEKICAAISHPENKKSVTITGPVMSLCYDKDYKETENDIECAIPLSGQLTVVDPEMEVKTFPACKVLSFLHKGSYQKLHETYAFLLKYMHENNLEISGPNRELYFNDPSEVSEEDLKTEIQIPIRE
jgi:effector-binding domain-containing protein